MKKAGVLLLLAGALAARAQQPGPTAASLKKSFNELAASTETDGETFGQLVSRTPRQLVAYLKAHDLTAAQARQMGLDYATAPDGSLQVYTYSYQSGGTRGTVHRSVLGWHNAAGQRFAYSTSEECDFSEVHKLTSPGRMQYLLLGQEKGDGSCNFSEAYVAELKGDFLRLDNAAFGKQPSFRLCNVPLTFVPATQALRLDLTDYSPDHDETLLPEWGRPTGKNLTLYFRNGRFGKSK